MASQNQYLLLLILVIFSFPILEPSESMEIVKVGVILDMKSTVGSMANRTISMALSDFYSRNSHYRTRLNLLTRDSQNDVVLAAFSAIDLMKNEKVHAIIGPQRSSEAKFVINLGEKAKVPIISFSATSPSLSPSEHENKFFVRSAYNDSSQVKALASIVKAYGWREIILIYEDTDYGSGLIPYLIDALQESDTRVRYRSVVSSNANDNEILMELEKLKKNRTTIFLVHMTASLGSKLFKQAKIAGMMSEGYAWIATQGLSTLLDPVKDMESMQGVLGLRPYIPSSKKLEHFKLRWIKSADKPDGSTGGSNLFGLWAYDTVWAIAMAVERAGIENSSFLKSNTSKSRVDIAALGTFEMGAKLLDTLINTTFEGLSGNFHLVNGQLEPSAFEIFNVIGTSERVIGYWTKEKELLSELNDNNGRATNNLKNPIWPGNTIDQPRKLKIGVPVREGFTEFIKVVENKNKTTQVSGFCYDMFHAVLQVLEFPLPYEFVPFHDGSFDELLHKIEKQEFDAAVGDTTIVANRSTFVDFTLPYSESGVSMLVLVKDDERKNFWIFLKPLSWDLWLTTGAAFIFTGLVVWVLEHRERVVNNLSRFVLIIWVFVVLILTQSYTASLTSMLTVQRLQPSFTDVKDIQKNGYFVGYQTNSFVKDLLTKKLNFNETRLKNYTTSEDYHDALSNGEVAAIFDEIPYIKIFLASYCSRYMMVGPTYRTDGFGFAFPLGSPLVPYISRAILKVTEDKEKMENIEKALGNQATCEGQGPTTLSSDSLSVYSFGGLFIIAGIASMSSLLIYVFNFVCFHRPELNNHDPERSFWSKIIDLMKHFDQRDPSLHPFMKRSESRVHPEASPEGNGASPDTDDMQNHSRDSNEGADTVGSYEEEAHSSVGNDASIGAPNAS
ncbi:glutamate receptor 2.8 [Citrus sinensis]|nr:glutamate receptor 2.8 [Citrus sinensis]